MAKYLIKRTKRDIQRDLTDALQTVKIRLILLELNGVFSIFHSSKKNTENTMTKMSSTSKRSSQLIEVLMEAENEDQCITVDEEQRTVTYIY